MVKSGGRPEYDELRYAVCALDALTTFDQLALMKLANGQREGKKPVLVYSAEWQHSESFERMKRALAKTPKDYVGWNNDPDNQEYLDRRKANKKIAEKFFNA